MKKEEILDYFKKCKKIKRILSKDMIYLLK